MKIKISLLSLFFLLACNASINESVYIKDGEVKDGNIISINGSITVGRDCKVLGDCKAVNGSIKIGN